MSYQLNQLKQMDLFSNLTSTLSQSVKSSSLIGEFDPSNILKKRGPKRHHICKMDHKLRARSFTIC